MAPRKSTSSNAGATGAEVEDTPTRSTSSPSQQPHNTTSAATITATEQQLKARAEGGASIEDYLLPRSLTLRLAKSVLPPNTSIQRDALLAIQKAATVFVSYLSSHANEATLKRTVAPTDVFAALSELEFDAFRARLELELDAFTEMKAGRRSGGGKGNKNKNGKDSGLGKGKAALDGTGDRQEDEEEEEESGIRGAKRVKRDGDEETAEDWSRNGNGVNGEMRSEDATAADIDQDEEEQGDEEEEDIDDEEEEEEEEDEEEEEEDDDEEVAHDDSNDIDRVEDLDRDSRPKRTMNPDVADDDSNSDSHDDDDDDDGPAAQLHGGFGLG